MGRLTRLGILLHVTLLTAASSSAMAEEVWKEVNTDDVGTIYAAPDTIAQHSGLKSMWELHDFKAANKISANGNVYLSKLRLVEYDCQDRKLQVAEETFFSDNMSKGRLLDRAGAVIGTTDSWIAVKPKTVEETLMNMTCADPRSGLYHTVLKKYALLKTFLKPRPPLPDVAVGP